MKVLPTLLIALLFQHAAHAQQISNADLESLKKGEAEMIQPALGILMSSRPGDRLKADSVFTRLLVKNLKTKGSFYYGFDSLQTISLLYAPDSLFRIFTWQLIIDDKISRQHGAIQMKTTDGSLKLFPLIDKSDVTEHYADTVGNNLGWMGAVYYKILMTKYSNTTFYTLLGYDENSILSSRKIIEVLRIVNNEPIFGGHYFSVPNDELIAKSPARYVMEFKKDAGPRLNYDNDLKMIVMEHLVSESNEPKKKYTLVGDGDYEGFRWMNGKWIYVSKIFDQVTPQGEPPVPSPTREDKRMEPEKTEPQGRN